ncbi:MAG: DEAD/DEAH box helicase, partial [Xanthomonadales bacterium]|nr:DEAD/DEAH box helicase [Xanthomonadales bacterium]
MRKEAIRECLPLRRRDPALPLPVAEPGKRELLERKAAVVALLEEGREADADIAFRNGNFPNHFWSEDTYRKNKEDQRNAIRNQIRRSVEAGDVENAQDLRQSCCIPWMTEDDFRVCVHQGLVNGSQWDKLGELAGADEVKKHVVPRLLRGMLAVDIESDGKDIWEIGIATAHDKCLLLSRHDNVDQTPEALGVLTARIGQTHILVGHNFLAWDWPILLSRISIEREPLIWDTLLVQFLLEPQAPTHALGSSHLADEDAKASADLFEQQLRRLPVCIAMKLVDESFASTVELLEAIAQALLNESRPSKPMPTWFPRDLQAPHTIVIVPEHRLRELDWVPAVTVVPADVDTGFAAPWRQIKPAQLEQALADEGIRGYRTSLVLAIARLAAAQDVALRRNMLPAWLVDGDAKLETAITRSSVVPDTNEGHGVAPMPDSTRWWTNADPTTYILAGISDDVLVLDREQAALNELVGDQQLMSHATFARVDDQGSMPRWVVRDRGMQVLEREGGLSRFSTWQIPARTAMFMRDVPGPHQRPILVTRQRPVLFPRAEDQASYWQDVLATVRELAAQGKHTVPILLISSSCSSSLQELIATGLAELHLGELKPEHRSRREHLLRASRNRHVLVDTLDQWPAWQALAATTGVVLQPVVEALPIEEWYASDATRATATGADNEANPAAPKPTGKPVAIEGDLLLGRLHELVSLRLHGWLCDAGLSTSVAPVVLIDPRLSAISRQLRSLVEFRPLQERPLTEEESRRLALAFVTMTVKREEAPNTLAAMEAFLVAHWQPKDQHAGNQVAGFKPTQRQAMELICQRTTHVLVSLPTGEGKSVLFQVPALCRGLRNRRLTLVISPLKALMRDQVERLRDQGFAESADYLSGDRPWHETMEVIQGVLDHRIVLLYVAPERLRSEAVVQVLAKRMLSDGGLEHVVVDEAHCVNQWGF